MTRKYAIIEAPKRYRGVGSSPKAAESDRGDVSVYGSDLSEKDVRDAQRDPNIKDVGLVMPIRLIRPVERSRSTENALLKDAWGIGAVGANQTAMDGSGVVVALLDTGIDVGHPSFQGVDIVQADFGGSGVGDNDGHGTHCAGTIFGKDVNGVRIGVARGIRKALIGKVFADEPSDGQEIKGDSLAVYRGLDWAVNAGADIVSMSLGYDFPGMVVDLERDGYPVDLATSIALEHFKDNLRMFDSMMSVIGAGRAFGRGPLVVAAAGNESRREIDPRFTIAASIPAAANGVISVAAVRADDGAYRLADFSNNRAKVCAPGGDVLSAAPNGKLVEMSGTSMACPHVAGAAALWWQQTAGSKIKANSETVSNNMLAAAVTEAIVGFDPDDAEVGLIKAPA